MTIINQPAHSIRGFYRNLGANKAIDRAIENINKDAVISTNLDVKLLERIIEILEAEKSV
jgi:hypothetical protein